MLIVLILLTVLAIIVGSITLKDFEIIPVFSFLGAVILGIIDLIVVGWIISIYFNGLYAKPKIEMYQEENQKIEEQIDSLVKNYMEYEGSTLMEFKVDSSITLVSLYPDLKSDELVSKQIETYINNNNKIKELKEYQIELKLGKWLLYFGK